MDQQLPIESSIETPLEPLKSVNLEPIGDDISVVATEGVNLIANLRILAEDPDTTADHLCDVLISGQKFFKSYTYKKKKVIFEEISVILIQLIKNWINKKNHRVILELIRSISFYVQNENEYKVAMGCLGICPLLCKIMEIYREIPEINGMICKLVIDLTNLKLYLSQSSSMEAISPISSDENIFRYGVKESEFLNWDNREKLLECGFISILSKNLRYWVEICEKYDKDSDESLELLEEPIINLKKNNDSSKKSRNNSINVANGIIKKSLESSYQFPEPKWMLDPPLIYVMTNFLECITSLCGNAEISALFYSLGVISSVCKLYIDIEPYLEHGGIVRYCFPQPNPSETPSINNGSICNTPNSINSFFSSPYVTQPNSNYSSLASTPNNRSSIKNRSKSSAFELEQVPVVVFPIKNIIEFQNSVLFCIILLTTSLGNSVKQNFLNNSSMPTIKVSNSSNSNSTCDCDSNKYSSRHHLASHRLIPHLWKCIDTEGLSSHSKNLRTTIGSSLKHFDYQCWLAMLLCTKCSECKEFSQKMGLPIVDKTDKNKNESDIQSNVKPESSIPTLPPIVNSVPSGETLEKPKNFILIDNSIFNKSEDDTPPPPPQPVVLTLLRYLNKETWIPDTTKKRLDKIFSYLFPNTDKKLPSFLTNPVENSTNLSSPLDSTHSGPFFRFSFSSDPIEVSNF